MERSPSAIATTRGARSRTRRGSQPTRSCSPVISSTESPCLDYAKARYYDPVVGRVPPPSTRSRARRSSPAFAAPWRYQYAYANPTAHVDRDGRCVGDLQQSAPRQAISRAAEHFMVGDALALAERDVEIHQKVVAGRRQFKRDFGRDPMPDDAVWSEGSRLLTAGFGEIDAQRPSRGGQLGAGRWCRRESVGDWPTALRGLVALQPERLSLREPERSSRMQAPS